jgi:hypothetical protein
MCGNGFVEAVRRFRDLAIASLSRVALGVQLPFCSRVTTTGNPTSSKVANSIGTNG